MQVTFKAFGHENIQAKHDKTLEFTKDKELSTRGDCIIGVNSNFSLKEIKKLLKFEKLKITLKVDNLTEEINCLTNKEFFDETEIVIRISEFNSKRTLGIRSDKSSKELKRELIQKMKENDKEMKVTIKGLQ